MSNNRLEKARCLLLTHEPWYGHVAMNMTWIETSIVRTMGVRVVHGGDVQCLYNPLFVKELTVPEICFVIQHEVEHVVRCHCLRNGLSDRLTFNVAADMVVNGSKSLPRIGITTDGARERPHSLSRRVDLVTPLLVSQREHRVLLPSIGENAR